EPPAGSRIAPGVRHRMADPSWRSVHFLRGPAAGDAKAVDQPEQWDLAFAEIANLGGPVILLGIDIEMKIIRPSHAACKAVVPYPLERQRQRGISARSGDSEISSVLEEQRQQ